MPTDTAGGDTSFMFFIRFMNLCVALIIVEKARARGEEVKRCRCCELVRDKELKIENVKASHTYVERRRWYPRRGKCKGGERFVSGRGECVRVQR